MLDFNGVFYVYASLSFVLWLCVVVVCFFHSKDGV